MKQNQVRLIEHLSGSSLGSIVLNNSLCNGDRYITFQASPNWGLNTSLQKIVNLFKTLRFYHNNFYNFIVVLYIKQFLKFYCVILYPDLCRWLCHVTLSKGWAYMIGRLLCYYLKAIGKCYPYYGRQKRSLKVYLKSLW